MCDINNKFTEIKAVNNDIECIVIPPQLHRL